jgi:hypothetical protein
MALLLHIADMQSLWQNRIAGVNYHMELEQLGFSEETKQMLEYFKGIESSEIFWCKRHNVEYISGKKCWVCKYKARFVKLGDRNPMWIGDGVGIGALHMWINKNRPRPISGLCEICDINPLYDAACITGIYDRYFDNWKYLCRSCHVDFDYKNGTRSHEKLSAALSGENHPMYGRHLSTETCRKIGISKLGNKYCVGRQISQETRQKISLTKWRDFNQICQYCASRRVIRHGTYRLGKIEMQKFQCNNCKKYWCIEKLSLQECHKRSGREELRE